jgi:hypothetical protein
VHLVPDLAKLIIISALLSVLASMRPCLLTHAQMLSFEFVHGLGFLEGKFEADSSEIFSLKVDSSGGIYLVQIWSLAVCIFL